MCVDEHQKEEKKKTVEKLVMCVTDKINEKSTAAIAPKFYVFESVIFA